MQWIKQEHARGCGVAAVAMILNKTYHEVHKDFLYVDDETGGRVREFDAYLAQHGYAIARRYQWKHDGTKVDQWPPVPFAKVHFCEVVVSKDSPCAHLVVMLEDGKVLDPLCSETKLLTDYHDIYHVAAVVRIDYGGNI